MASRACTQPTRRLAGAAKAAQAAQLLRVRHVLRVIDADDGAAREGQGGVQRFRLGARAGVGRGEDVEAGAFGVAGQRRRGLVVVGLDDQQHLQLLARIVERG
ncbi:hypothetical protein J2X65_002191 [Ancylobacter sp. 3268]|nr:hypothetical protein [Ancylobacter sp. 3268]